MHVHFYVSLQWKTLYSIPPLASLFFLLVLTALPVNVHALFEEKAGTFSSVYSWRRTYSPYPSHWVSFPPPPPASLYRWIKPFPVIIPNSSLSSNKHPGTINLSVEKYYIQFRTKIGYPYFLQQTLQYQSLSLKNYMA